MTRSRILNALLALLFAVLLRASVAHGQQVQNTLCGAPVPPLLVENVTSEEGNIVGTGYARAGDFLYVWDLTTEKGSTTLTLHKSWTFSIAERPHLEDHGFTVEDEVAGDTGESVIYRYVAKKKLTDGYKRSGKDRDTARANYVERVTGQLASELGFGFTICDSWRGELIAATTTAKFVPAAPSPTSNYSCTVDHAHPIPGMVHDNVGKFLTDNFVRRTIGKWAGASRLVRLGFTADGNYTWSITTNADGVSIVELYTGTTFSDEARKRFTEKGFTIKAGYPGDKPADKAGEVASKRMPDLTIAGQCGPNGDGPCMFEPLYERIGLHVRAELGLDLIACPTWRWSMMEAARWIVAVNTGDTATQERIERRPRKGSARKPSPDPAYNPGPNEPPF